jgi:hypothetical protein
MVPPYSDKVSRAPPYFSLAQYHTGLFTYRTITCYGQPFHARSVKSCAITNRLFRFRSPLLSESRLISFPRATEMFQFTRFASMTYEFSHGIPFGGFPHSDTSGSKLICQLPEAFRRLSRPSSPIIAKASTICSYSLDPITLTSQPRFAAQSKTKSYLQGMFCLVFHQTRYAVSIYD